MQTLTDLTALVEKLASALPSLNLDGDEQEEYSTMPLWLQNQAETGEPSEAVIREYLPYFARFECRTPGTFPTHQSAEVLDRFQVQ